MVARKILIGVVLLFSGWKAASQEKTLSTDFYQFIDEDSVALYFNNRYNFVEKGCLQYIRLVKLNKAGKFEGYFEDLSIHDRLLGRGFYTNGERDGEFEIYYPTGPLRVKGVYAMGKPVDQWEYFYENGMRERRLRFTQSDTLLLDYADSAGNVLVRNGNGQFKGPVNALIGASEHYIIAEGLVVNGKPHGNWVGMAGEDWLFCNEEFELGKYSGGTSPGSKRPKKQHFKHLSKFILKDYFAMLDGFYTERCADSARYAQRATHVKSTSNGAIPKRTFNARRFQSYLREAVGRSISSDIRNNPQDYGGGNYYLTIRFSVDKEGKPDNFAHISTWGSALISEVKSCLSAHAQFPVSQKEVYFHLKFTFSGNALYTYRYAFSGSAINQL